MVVRKRYAFADRDTQSLAEDVADQQRALHAFEAVDGVTLRDLAFTGGGSTVVAHNLRFKPRGFVVMRAIGADPGLFCTTAQWEARNDATITISATTTATVDLRVF